jgi:hypothetical protein
VRESPLMGKTYSHALCSIGATASSSSNQVCFCERKPILLDDIISGNNSRLNSYQVYDQFTISEHFDDSLLLHRGWVVQEHTLSRIFLHFGAEQVFWDCRDLFASEMYPRGIPSIIAKQPIDFPLKLKAPSFLGQEW